jgi:HK97 family phage major capsid protein
VRTYVDVKREIDALTEKRDALREEADVIDSKDPGQLAHRARLVAGSANANAQIETLQKEYGTLILRAVEDNPYMAESGDGGEPGYGEQRVERWDRSIPASTRAARSAGLRAIERNKDILSPAAGDRLEHVLRERDPMGLGAAYIAAVADPAYQGAFGKLLSYGNAAHLRMSREELASVQAVVQADEQRAMSVGTGTAGGFGVPIDLDPSILLSSNGVLNPIRQLARVETTVADIWKGVSSDGVTASFAAEAAEVGDNAPTLAQPSITTQKAQAFVPFSIEVGMDYVGLQAELGQLFADAKDTLEATAFLTGTGTNEPGGILNIGGTGGLTTTQRILTDVAATLDIDDVWDLKGNLTNTRFASSATFAGNSAMIDRIFRFTPAGSTTEPQAMPTREGPLMGRPVAEWSTMVNTTTTGSKVLIFADFKACYRIVDRIGLSVELIPHLFAAANHRPSGQRGLYAFWRVGGGVQVANAARYLEVA